MREEERREFVVVDVGFVFFEKKVIVVGIVVFYKENLSKIWGLWFIFFVF